jgi:sialic acid synthase SpsE
MTAQIVAEVGSNWNPGAPLESWQALIEAAAEAGADVVKGQDWHPIEQIDRPQEWKRRCGRWTLDPEWHGDLRLAAFRLGMSFGCSVFTQSAVARTITASAATIRPAMLKLPSSAISDSHLLWFIGGLPMKHPAHSLDLERSWPPIYLSLGEATTPFQVSTAIARLARYDLTLLACIAEYPVEDRDRRASLRLLDALTFAKQFGLPVGISSHVAYPDAIRAARNAVKKGAVVVEAHLRLQGVTPDDAPDNGPWALWPEEFKELVEAVREVE